MIDEFEIEREEIAKIIANNAPSDSQYDASDYEWAAHSLQIEGYRKRKKGKWIIHHTRLFEKEYYTCSECQSKNPLAIKFNYCFNCGAEMEEQNNRT